MLADRRTIGREPNSSLLSREANIEGFAAVLLDRARLSLRVATRLGRPGLPRAQVWPEVFLGLQRLTHMAAEGRRRLRDLGGAPAPVGAGDGLPEVERGRSMPQPDARVLGGAFAVT
jgi:hypothetical protein